MRLDFGVGDNVTEVTLGEGIGLVGALHNLFDPDGVMNHHAGGAAPDWFATDWVELATLLAAQWPDAEVRTLA